LVYHLEKEGGYRKAFAGFDVEAVAKFDEDKIAELLTDVGIIRNKLKVNAAVNNAKRPLDVQAEFGSFNTYIWSFVGGAPLVSHIENLSDYPATSKESDALSKDLKKRGFKFVGPTICYAHMQAAGLVNDHSVDCYRRQEIINNY
jgi:DNA-3-methyladenine glycosylase I